MLNHPCFEARARHSWGRIHLPVAPVCNIRCAYCDRRSDCVNESRPGVSSKIMKPQEAADYLALVLKSRTDISVAGIAGPGDPLASPEITLLTLRLIKNFQIKLCLSTNGLNLTEYIPELKKLGVRYTTLTINAVDPAIGSRIYLNIKHQGQLYTGLEGASILLKHQVEALAALKSQGITVKINSVVIPGINDGHIQEIARLAAFYEADLMNCLALIPVPGTAMAGISPPDSQLMEKVRQEAEMHVKQMYHCSRCRADALGLLTSPDLTVTGNGSLMPATV